MILRLISIFFFLLIVLSQCSNTKQLPKDFQTIFSNWFIFNNDSLANIISYYSPTSKQLDSVSYTLRKNNWTKGHEEIILNDSDGTLYVSGFYKPKNDSGQKLYPLLIYLHGGIGTNRHDKGRNAYEMFNFLADSIPIFIASPSGNRHALWWNNTGMKRIMATIRAITLHYPIDPNRIFLAGVSDGATGCYAVANAAIAPFAGFIAVSGFGGMLNTQFGIKIKPQNIMQRPIYNINAENDRLYPIQQVNRFTTWLRNNGVPIEAKVYPNQEHGFDYKYQETKKLISILKSWKKTTRKSMRWNYVPNVTNKIDKIVKIDICPNKTSASILVYPKDDTLIIKHNNISTLTFCYDNESKILYYKTKEKKSVVLKPDKQIINAELANRINLCYPILGVKKYFTVKF